MPFEAGVELLESGVELLETPRGVLGERVDALGDGVDGDGREEGDGAGREEVDRGDPGNSQGITPTPTTLETRTDATFAASTVAVCVALTAGRKCGDDVTVLAIPFNPSAASALSFAIFS